MVPVVLCYILLLFKSINCDIPNCNGGNGKDKILSLPGYKPDGNTSPSFTQYSGFIQVNKTANGSIFYWYIESIANNVDKTTPVLVWLNGGPGASSLSGLFAENGPFRINSSNLNLYYNNASWVNYYHMIFVDNPIGTGFSFCNNDSYVTNEDQMGEDFVSFLKGFYECHPEINSNPLYITGESYAGRYIPFIAKWIINDNQISDDIPLAGLAIGNGIYDPYLQFPSAPDYAYNLGILDKLEYEQISANVQDCLALASTDPYTAADECVAITNDIYSVYGGNIFQYNVYFLNADIFDVITGDIGSYLAQSSVARAIHTDGIPWKSSDGTSSPNPVYEALKYDIMMNNSASIIPLILSNKIRILFYNGQLDGSICNNYGNQQCLNQLNYNNEWITLSRCSYKINKITAGYVKQSTDKLLTYFVVSDSGHLVPYDQPYSSLSMIYNYIQEMDWC